MLESCTINKLERKDKSQCSICFTVYAGPNSFEQARHCELRGFPEFEHQLGATFITPNGAGIIYEWNVAGRTHEAAYSVAINKEDKLITEREVNSLIDNGDWKFTL